MRLVIGGYAQGKLAYVLQKYQIKEDAVFDAVFPQKAFSKVTVINHFHSWVKSCMMRGGCPEKEVLSFLEDCENCIIISDEIGNGIVPIDPWEREYRERTGRILVELAGRAEEVVRVICGIGQKVK